MAIRMNQIAILHSHPKNCHGRANLADVHKCVARAYGPCDHGKAVGQIAQITHHTVCKRTRQPKPFVYCCINLAPIRANAMGEIDVLNHGKGGSRALRHVTIIIHAAISDDLGGLGRRFNRGNLGGSGISHHHTRRGMRCQHRATGEHVEPALALGHLDCIAHRRCIHRLQQGQ